MKKLIYVPVIHMDVDLGSLSTEMVSLGISDFGEKFWERHKTTIAGFWDSVAAFFSKLAARGLRIYQDGMVADGEMGLKIVEEGVRGGSKNYEVVGDLLGRGAVLVKTEDIALVREEMEYIKKIFNAKTVSEKMNAVLTYKIKKKGLLKRRDEFIARRIMDTLDDGDAGVLFIGAYHNVKDYLPDDISVVELKDMVMVREYQKMVPAHKKNKDAFDKLSAYLVAPVEQDAIKGNMNKQRVG